MAWTIPQFGNLPPHGSVVSVSNVAEAVAQLEHALQQTPPVVRLTAPLKQPEQPAPHLNWSIASPALAIREFNFFVPQSAQSFASMTDWLSSCKSLERVGVLLPASSDVTTARNVVRLAGGMRSMCLDLRWAMKGGQRQPPLAGDQAAVASFLHPECGAQEIHLIVDYGSMVPDYLDAVVWPAVQA